MCEVYACLLGNWVCLNDDPNCVIGDNGQNPNSWWKEEPGIWYPINRKSELENSFYDMPYVNIYYKNDKYRISPVLIQIKNG